MSRVSSAGAALAVCLAFGFLVLAPSLWGQATTQGNIVGVVLDPSGAAIPGATVVVENKETGFTREVTSGPNGNFQVFSLNPGFYRVRVSAPNFQTQVQDDIKLNVAQTVRLDFTLSVGAVTETVEVQAQAAMLQTQDGTVGTVVENKKVTDLPLNGRNFNQLTRLVPGATRGANAAGQTIQGETFSVTGGRSDQNYYSLDGMFNNGTFFKTAAIHPPIDAIQEFKIQTNTSAKYGAAAGANINVSTKSGTNEIHGRVWEFFRNDKLDSRDYFRTERQSFKHNQFGAAIGGPIKRNKTFWFFSWESFRERRGQTQAATIPTVAMRNGDLSRTLEGDPANPIFNPLTSREVDGQLVRDPFPNNQIPQNMIQEIARVYADLWWPTNLTPGSSVNFFNTASQARDDDKFITRIDHSFSPNNNFFGRLSVSDLQQDTPGNVPAATVGNTNKFLGVSLSDTHVFSPTFIVEMRAGYLRNNLRQGPTQQFIQQYRDAGLTNTPLTFQEFDFPINFGVQGFTGPNLGNLINGPDFVYQGSVDATWVKGNHKLTFGYNYTRLNVFHDSVFQTFNFTNLPTSDPQNVAGTGSSLASFLLGTPENANRIVGQTDLHIRHDLHHGYLQDDIQVNSNLTVNLGLRYEYNQWPHHIRGRLGGFDTLTNQFIWTSRNPVNGEPANVRPEIADPDWQNWAPRIGFAYRIGDRTVIRSAYGIFYNSNFSWEWSTARGNWPFSVSDNITNLNTGTEVTFFDDLFQSFDPSVVTPQAQHTVSRDLNTPYMQNWNFGIEHQLTEDLLVELNYQGAKGTMLPSFLSTNDALPGPGAVNPRRPWPVNGSFSELKHIATSKYQGLTAKVEKRYSNGLSFLFSYAWQKSIDLNSQFGGSSPQQVRTCIECDLGRSDFDQQHVSNFSWVYELPFLKNSTGLAKHLLGGWSVTGILTLETGRPFNVIIPFDNANVGSRGNFQRPDLAGEFQPDGFEPAFGPSQFFFNTDAFAVPEPFTFGNLGRNAVQGPGFKNLDLGLFKNVNLSERFDLQIRSEFFNIFNNTNFANPGSAITTPAFGTISSTVTTQRQIQFGLKLLF